MTTTIRRERHRPLWQRAAVLAPLLLITLGLGLAWLAWHLGAPVPVRPMAIALPDAEVGAQIAATSAVKSGG